MKVGLYIFSLVLSVGLFAESDKAASLQELAKQAASAVPIGAEVPYQAKWTYTAYGPFTKVKQTVGTLDIDYVSPVKWREYITNDLGYAETHIQNGNDEFIKFVNAKVRPLREQQMLEPFEALLRMGAETKSRPRKAKVDGNRADCFQTEASIYAGEYCFDEGSLKLLSMTNSGVETRIFSWRKVGSRELPERWEVRSGPHLLVKAELAEASEQADTNEALFRPPVGSVRHAALPNCPNRAFVGGRKTGGDVPQYPPIPRMNRESGRVVMAAKITPLGTIDELTVLESPGPAFDESALKAVRTWRYDPLKVCGQPMEVRTLITVNYQIRR